MSKELERNLARIGGNLLKAPSDVKELVTLLDKLEALLSMADQSPSESMSDALYPVMKGLISKEVLGHHDADVRLASAACLSEITRITAPEPPYDDALMKKIFQLIVEALGNLDEISSHSYPKRVKILETAAKVKSYVMMFDIDCEALILDMFHHFLRTIRDDHSENVFSAMEVIMSVVLEEGEDISSELLSLLLKSLRNDNKDILPVARRLVEKVVGNCSIELKSCLTNAVKSVGAPMSDYSAVISSVCQADDNQISEEMISEEPAQACGKIESEVSYPEVVTGLVKSPKSVMSNGNLSPKKDVSPVEPCTLDQKKMTENKSEDAENDLILSGKKKDQAKEIKETAKKLQEGVPLKKRGRKPRVDTSENAPITTLVSKIKKQKEKISDRGKDVVSTTKAASKTDFSPKPEYSRKRAREEEPITPRAELKYNESLVGRKIRVWWPDDAKFYPGVIVSYNPNTKKHKVLYSDGDKETLSLKSERFEFIGSVKSKDETVSTPEASTSKMDVKKKNSNIDDDESGRGRSSSHKPRKKSRDETGSRSVSKPGKKGVAEAGTSSKEVKSQSLSKSGKKGSFVSENLQKEGKSGKKRGSNLEKLPKKVNSCKKESSDSEPLPKKFKSGKKDSSDSENLPQKFDSGKKRPYISEKLPKEVDSGKKERSDFDKLPKNGSSDSQNLAEDDTLGKKESGDPENLDIEMKSQSSDSDESPNSGRETDSAPEKSPDEEDAKLETKRQKINQD